MTEELRLEGIARELVNRIQNVRKSKNFDITDRITVTIVPDERTDAAVKAFGDYIARQVLAGIGVACRELQITADGNFDCSIVSRGSCRILGSSVSLIRDSTDCAVCTLQRNRISGLFGEGNSQRFVRRDIFNRSGVAADGSVAGN